jgi:hypothetical protein
VSEPHRSLPVKGDWLLALAAGLLAGSVYGCMAAPGVLPGDSGELQFAAWLAGLSHPTGYPLYLIMGWLWSHVLEFIGLASPARAMTLLSALFGALAVALTYLLAAALIAQSRSTDGAATPSERIAALVAALTFAWTPTMWSQAVVAEVYTLHAALVAAILWLALLWRDSPEIRFLRRVRISLPLAALTLLFGLGLAHHRTTLLLLPVLLVFLAWQAPVGYWRLRQIVLLALLALAPLLLYLYVPLRAPTTPYLTIELRPGQVAQLVDRSSAGLLNYLLGQGFAGEIGGPTQAMAAAPSLAMLFAAELTLVGLLLAGAGVAVLALRRQWPLLWLTGGSFVMLTGFNLFYTIGDIRVFYIPSFLIASVWIGEAVVWLAGAVGRLVGRRRPGMSGPSSVVTAALLGALPVYLFLSHAAALDRSQDTRAADAWQALLRANPLQNAILISNDRDELMPLWYLQQVERVRPDLAGVFPLLLAEAGWLDVGQVVDSALATGRPVYLIKPMPGLEVKVELGQSDPSGLTSVLGPAVSRPPTFDEGMVIGDVMNLVGYDVTPRAVTPGETLQVDLQWQPLRQMPANLTSFVHLLAPDGTRLAQSDRLLGGVFYPTRLWQPGETLLDRHEFVLPADAPPGPYRLVVGLYELVGNEPRAVGEATLTHAVGE